MEIPFLPPKNLTVISNASYAPPVFIEKKADLIEGLPDGILALIAPIVAYWVYSTFFHIIDVYKLAEAYRIHPSEEELAKNKAKISDVIKDVILQHIIQTIAGIVFYKLDKIPTTGYELNQMWYWKQKFTWVPNEVIWFLYTYGVSFFKVVLAFIIIDTWQFMLHRLMHVNKYLYSRFHSRHHRLQVPYAYGALYNDPVEGFLLDTCGTGVAGLLTGLTSRESLFLYTFSTMKTIDDHCGYRLPLDPFQFIFPNNSVYHDIHHQSWGFKHNFSQPFFTFWDRWFGTKYEFIEEYKELQKKVTLEKYKEFLNEKTKGKYNYNLKKDKKD
ncbi:Sphingolipid C4-hydroxylase sur2 [Yamadazyma tenuis]|uniref:Fatty acid hydroxylase domain-containing protein n=1 Tax=Candida tenuis (strain ATCC 10573 / BCRC 21748 / CBS 615 / JCM 9827 / NBRC 10315 / NRRL Y-1498 / VKM Y-70) TaxID=590646 RepID=G3BDN8_CANTC|nr:uncharacterized protein CANTEDRAFT_116396 [Yamadazyma tenuis ATCC 10573]XP_006690316.1 uncharacterized protein CANTEDRAFT_116396 [Yamadazyma tenuis ATCC 10573]EGV61101.1 hypothetical protein CANTEDRAFT_116396 [Yamadazyma tenuis ATCC 10573]EGV61102.1 hypothetical protein CANTEDRAFT_116396 [Yamadazyma tenuis ATCC 10573]WEJ94413.1 Sphingolipid C4-hydroxylase sur2 [Yamadazyma tenuis]